jgi:DNA invertase Pin-like site-specific DNA recombinase
MLLVASRNAGAGPRCEERGGQVRAAQYVRMSTEHQRYSTENQSVVIAEYAQRFGLEIVCTYADEGKSGLRIEGRDALKQLIGDVQKGCPEFSVILVYDVSRWGRFQDADESAYYEYICRRAGVEVRYCAEQFENDGSISSTIVKTVKRAMAGEYSRELSVKVFAGQCRLVELGFRQGGASGYGFRRQLIDQYRAAKGELSRGERKGLQTDRVILVPGPPQEVETVQWVYRMFVHEAKSEAEIAAALNVRGICTDFGRSWTRGTVHQVLTNEKYVGNNVFNRVSFKLKKKRVVNSPHMWIRKEGAFESIVDPATFLVAQTIVAERNHRFSDVHMIAVLKTLYEQRGILSGLIIDEMEGMPSSGAYRSRFGSLLRAYQLVGFEPLRDYRYIEINRALRRMHPNIVADVIAQIEALGSTVASDPITDLLTINSEFTVSVIIARCMRTSAGALRWKLRLDTGLWPDITLVLRMDAENRDRLDYYLLPKIDMPAAKISLAEENGIYLDAYRFDSLDYFFTLASRTNIRSAA